MEGEIKETAMKGRCVIRSLTKHYERKECIHGGKERIKEQFMPVNPDVWMKDMDME